jgi:hypothetical protein
MTPRLRIRKGVKPGDEVLQVGRWSAERRYGSRQGRSARACRFAKRRHPRSG